MARLRSWFTSGFDSLALVWSEPLTYLVALVAVGWLVARRVRGRASFFGDALRVLFAGWLIGVLALTVYPLSHASTDWFEAGRPMPRMVPLAATANAVLGTGARQMADADYETRRAQMARDLGVPVEEVELERVKVFIDRSAVTKDVVGNTLMFIPFGALVPAIWRRFSKPLAVVGLAAGVSLMIELSQLLLTLGAASIDDVVFNALGAFLGWATWWGGKQIIEATPIVAT